MTTFLIKHDDVITTVVMDITDTMLHLKKLIIKEMKIETKYLDLNFLLEKPIRGFGKMNLEKGILPRTMDNFPFNRYNLEGKEVICEYIIVDDYSPDRITKTDVSDNVYIPPGMKTGVDKVDKVKKVPITYDLESVLDFPSL